MLSPQQLQDSVSQIQSANPQATANPGATNTSLDQLKASSQPAQNSQGSGKGFLWDAAGNFLNGITNSEQSFGQDLSTIGSSAPQQAADTNARAAASKQQLMLAIHNQPDPTMKQHLLDAYQKIWGNSQPLTAGDINPAFNKTPEQVIGDAGGVALDAASGGTYGDAAKGAETGKLLTAVPSAVSSITDAAKGGEGIVKGAIKGAQEGAITGAGVGTAYGADQGLKNNQGVGGVATSAAQGGVTGLATGGILGGVAGAAPGVLKAGQDAITNRAESNNATNEAVQNIANQEKGIVPQAKTPAQLAQESRQKTWDVIKPKLSADEAKSAAASGQLVRTGENGVLTHIPGTKDLGDIKLAQPYVEAAGGDPVKTAANIKNGIATEAQNLRTAVGERGGTWSTSNIKGVLNDVKIPLAIKNGPEMAQIKNINEFVTNLANTTDKNAGGALDLSQQFRKNINSEYGENIWGKNTPIGNYIKSVNQSLNDFISTRLPDGKLPDGTLIKDSFAKQTRLYNILDNIQLPKLGDTLVNPEEEDSLTVPGSPLGEKVKELGNNHPIIKKGIKLASGIAGLGAATHLIP